MRLNWIWAAAELTEELKKKSFTISHSTIISQSAAKKTVDARTLVSSESRFCQSESAAMCDENVRASFTWDYTRWECEWNFFKHFKWMHITKRCNAMRQTMTIEIKKCVKMRFNLQQMLAVLVAQQQSMSSFKIAYKVVNLWASFSDCENGLRFALSIFLGSAKMPLITWFLFGTTRMVLNSMKLQLSSKKVSVCRSEQWLDSVCRSIRQTLSINFETNDDGMFSVHLSCFQWIIGWVSWFDTYSEKQKRLN